MQSIPGAEHYDQDRAFGNSESDEVYAEAMEELNLPEDLPDWSPKTPAEAGRMHGEYVWPIREGRYGGYDTKEQFAEYLRAYADALSPATGFKPGEL